MSNIDKKVKHKAEIRAFVLGREEALRRLLLARFRPQYVYGLIKLRSYIHEFITDYESSLSGVEIRRKYNIQYRKLKELEQLFVDEIFWR